jgi:peptidoglycan/xylan/chitin deacetylase (PgdA/CDA1 family)
MSALDREINGLKTQLEQLIQLKAEEEMNRSLSPDTAENVEAFSVDTEAGASVSVSDDTEQYKHMVYLTFDDGPSIYTDEILDILAEYDVKATFFVVGKEDDVSKAALKRIVSEGHTLGMHSYSHRYTDIYGSLDAFSADFTKLQNYLYEQTGVKSKFYRFPGGSSNTVSPTDMHEFAEYLDEQGVIFFDWNISSGDASGNNISVDKIVSNSTGEIERWRTSLILMHDSADKHTTVEALPKIIENILAMDDTVILPITENTDTRPVQHIHMETN